MYALLDSLIGYTGQTNVTSNIVYGCIAFALLFTVLIIDWIATFIGRFFR